MRQLREEVEFWKAESYKHFCDAQYWRAMHQQALERIAQRDQEIDRLKAEVRGLRQQLFGRKTEKGKAAPIPQGLEKIVQRPAAWPTAGPGRARAPGPLPFAGRSHASGPSCRRTLLPAVPPAIRRVPRHGRQRDDRDPRPRPPSRDPPEALSTDLFVPGVPGIITAPAPPRLFAKGIVGISVWVMVLLDKYQFYRPTHRLLEDLRTYGVDLPAGTLTDGLKRFLPLLEPIYGGIIAESRRGVLWSADETRWMVFVQIEKKSGYRWYLWAFQSATAIAFELDPSRSHRVPDGHFQGVEGGILLVDRYAGYKAMDLVKDGTILLGLLLGACAAGLRGRRQELAEVGGVGPGVVAGYPRSCTISTGNGSSAAKTPPRLPRTTANCERPSTAMAAKRDEQLGHKDLHPACRKTLQSLSEHWKGLTLFVEHPDVPDGQQSHRTHAARPGGGAEELLRLGGAVERQVGGDALLLVRHAEAPRDQPAAMADRLLGSLRGGGRQDPEERRGLSAMEHVRGIQGGNACPLPDYAGSQRLFLTLRTAMMGGQQLITVRATRIASLRPFCQPAGYVVLRAPHTLQEVKTGEPNVYQPHFSSSCGARACVVHEKRRAGRRTSFRKISQMNRPELAQPHRHRGGYTASGRK